MALGQTKINGLTFSTTTGRNVYTPNTTSVQDDYWCYTNVGPSTSYSSPTASIIPLLSVVIPPETLKGANIWSIDCCLSKNVGNAITQIYVYFNNQDSLSGATLVATGALNPVGTLYMVLTRRFLMWSTSIIYTATVDNPANGDLTAPTSTNNQELDSITITPTDPLYIIMAASFSASTTTITGEWLKASSRSYFG